jgi:hypothetical protein
MIYRYSKIKKKKGSKQGYGGAVNAKRGRSTNPLRNYLDDSDGELNPGPPDIEQAANERVRYELSYQVLEKLLLHKLQSCQKCGKARLCMVDKEGTHQDINYNQLCTWCAP